MHTPACIPRSAFFTLSQLTILSALLNDVRTEGDKVKLAVTWGEQLLLQQHLQQQACAACCTTAKTPVLGVY